MPSSPTSKKIVEVGPGCYNLRAPFKVIGGLVDVGTHMSLIRLSTGGYVALSTVELDTASKAELDVLTSNGELLEAVIATNPFHTMAFPSFYTAYPDAKYYGTPRHLKNIPQIPWSGDVSDRVVRTFWSPDIELEIPEGAEFVAPVPESYNHFSGIVAFHAASKTLICDDCFSVSAKAQCRFTTPAGTPKEYNETSFHISLYGPALHKTPEAPKELYKWMLKIIHDWDFENMATAHGGVQYGGSKRSLTEGLAKLRRFLNDTAGKRGGSLR
ncbi:hypothetical protein BC830DRAFT_1171970 [Chytriomyces sp. MP71]|nr:hypothetical protein BC830DRAFT_1171970 [Chytriomyces sp. MP71]